MSLMFFLNTVLPMCLLLTSRLMGTTVVVLPFLTVRKAFDCVPHRRLLTKLQSYGITGKSLDWIKDFLADRKHRVSIRDSFSDCVK